MLCDLAGNFWLSGWQFLTGVVDWLTFNVKIYVYIRIKRAKCKQGSKVQNVRARCKAQDTQNLIEGLVAVRVLLVLLERSSLVASQPGNQKKYKLALCAKLLLLLVLFPLVRPCDCVRFLAGEPVGEKEASRCEGCSRCTSRSRNFAHSACLWPLLVAVVRKVATRPCFPPDTAELKQ